VGWRNEKGHQDHCRRYPAAWSWWPL